jgi:molybdate transport system regulatory protein
MKPKVNLWIEIDGQVVLSRWRVGLLNAIAETGSISAAAELLGVPYRRAWEKIHEMEKRLGGLRGGGAQLTPAAQDFVARFLEFSEGIDRHVQQQFQDAFTNYVE